MNLYYEALPTVKPQLPVLQTNASVYTMSGVPALGDWARLCNEHRSFKLQSASWSMGCPHT